MYRRVVEAKRFIDDHYAENIDLTRISDQAHFSKYHFLRLFKQAFGTSPHKYLTEVRINAAKKRLLEGDSIASVCFAVGFTSIPSFITLFRKHVGLTPGEYVTAQQRNQQAQRETPFRFVPNCFVHAYGWNE